MAAYTHSSSKTPPDVKGKTTTPGTVSSDSIWKRDAKAVDSPTARTKRAISLGCAVHVEKSCLRHLKTMTTDQQITAANAKPQNVKDAVSASGNCQDKLRLTMVRTPLLAVASSVTINQRKISFFRRLGSGSLSRGTDNTVTPAMQTMPSRIGSVRVSPQKKMLNRTGKTM